MNRSVTARTRNNRTRTAIILTALVALFVSIFMTTAPAGATQPTATTSAVTVSAPTSVASVSLPLTKKCTTKLNGVSLPSYEVDSMWVTLSWSSTYGMYRYRVERTPNHTVTVKLASGSYRYYEHHIDNIQMLPTTTLVGKSVNYPGNVTYFYAKSPYRDFKMKAHVQDAPYVNIFPTCQDNF